MLDRLFKKLELSKKTLEQLVKVREREIKLEISKFVLKPYISKKNVQGTPYF